MNTTQESLTQKQHQLKASQNSNSRQNSKEVRFASKSTVNYITAATAPARNDEDQDHRQVLGNEMLLRNSASHEKQPNFLKKRSRRNVSGCDGDSSHHLVTPTTTLYFNKYYRKDYRKDKRNILKFSTISILFITFLLFLTAFWHSIREEIHASNQESTSPKQNLQEHLDQLIINNQNLNP